MKQIIIGIFLVFTVLNVKAQCGLVGKNKDKKTGIENSDGVIISKDFIGLGITKLKKPEEPAKYHFILNVPSRRKLSDSILKSNGTFELHLNDGTIYEIDNGKCFNNPLGQGNSIGFKVEVKETQLKEICSKSFSKVKVFGIIETEFSKRAQKQQIKIMNCLLN